MKSIGLDDVSQVKKQDSEQVLVDLIRSKYPNLDLRSGTALRDLLIVPDAIIHAWFSSQLEEQRAVSSLQILLERANNGEEIDTDDISRVLSNFNLEGTAGSSAKGVVKVVVSQARTYVLQEGFEFSSLSGNVFRTTSSVTALENPGASDVKLFKGSANYYFLVPVVCSQTGQAGNITKGTVLTAGNALPGFLSAYAYDDFSGGSDIEDLASVKARIQTALSVRGLLNKNAVDAVLRDRFDSTDNPIIAVSVVGYGNPAQLRDKHNPFGVGVGGRVDIYVRNFTAPYVNTLTTKFSYNDDDDTYVADMAIPGMYSISSVADRESEAISSYRYSVEYTNDVEVSGIHDIDTSEGSVELAGSAWRSCRIKIFGVEKTTDEREFNVSAICLPNILDMQNYVDEDYVRNVGSDFIIRCPAVCRVSMDITCRYPFGTVFNVTAAKNAVANYVNTTGFIGRLTRSEIACVLTDAGASSVDIVSDHMLNGLVVDANGTSHKLYGDALDIDNVADPANMLTKDTCVFSTSPDNINIVAIPA